MAHPKIIVAETKTEKVLNLIGMITIIGVFSYTFYMFSSLPETIPIHFNGAGEPDGWGSRIFSLFLPILMAVLFVGLYILSRFPHVFNYPIKITEENATRVYPIGRQFMAIINFEMVLLFAYLQIESIQSAVSPDSNISDLNPVLFLFIPLVTCIIFFIRLSKIK